MEITESQLLQNWRENTENILNPDEMTGADYLFQWEQTDAISIHPVELSTPADAVNYINALFYEEAIDRDPPTRYTKIMCEALTEISDKTAPNEFEEILKLVVVTMQSVAAYKFESIDAYLQIGDYRNNVRNIFHPARMIALGAYMSQLIVYDYQIRAELIDSLLASASTRDFDTLNKIKDLCLRQVAPYYFHRKISMPEPYDTRKRLNLPMLKPSWQRIEAFNSARNVETAEIITPNDWRTFDFPDFYDHKEILEGIFPEVNIAFIISSLPMLMGSSRYEKI